MKRKCQLCKISVANEFIPCFRDGNENNILFIGEAPGTTERRLKVPFTGKSGTLLREFIKTYGLTDFSTLTNVIKCQPYRNEDPTDVEITNCRPFLMEDLQEVKPKLIVLVGKIPLQVFLGTKVEYAKPYINVPLMVNGVIIIPIYHPAYILRNNSYATYFTSFNSISKAYKTINKYYQQRTFNTTK